MRIVGTERLEDCFDGSSAYSYCFNGRWTRTDILALDALGQVDYYPGFPRPFFRVRGREGWVVKGVEGEDNCHAVFPGRGAEEGKQRFEAQFGDDAEG
ncbi:MAG TPA: hypothetical protein VGN26_04955 [Armatimonadota bacterium]|jgi:hypothetical protein